MAWWQWILLGAALLGAELFAVDTGFYLAILGLAALLVGLGAGAGLADAIWLQWVAFGAVSVVLLVGVRRHFLGWARRVPPSGVEPLIGETATVVEAIPAGGTGRARLRGTVWTARNTGPDTLASGRRARVEGVANLVIELRAEEDSP